MPLRATIKEKAFLLYTIKIVVYITPYDLMIDLVHVCTIMLNLTEELFYTLRSDCRGALL